MTNTIVYRRFGKNLGEFDGKVLRKKMQGSKHIFRKLDAWGLDAELLDKILVPKDAEIRILDSETEIVYSISATEAREKGLFYHFKGEKEDHGTQIFIPRSAFHKAPQHEK